MYYMDYAIELNISWLESSEEWYGLVDEVPL
jgi:hypothetical protein